jgi:hypothetical protein
VTAVPVDGRHAVKEANMAKNNQETRLSAKQQRAIEALLNGMTKGQAATAAGVIPRTLSRWLADPDFQAELNTASDQVIKAAATRLKSTLDAAVTVMRETMEDRQVNAAVRLRAADRVASHALKLVEAAELLERIERLEDRLK